MRKLKLLFSMLLFASMLHAQETYPVNGVADKRVGCYAFTNATIVKDAQTTITNATLVIREGSIISVGTGIIIPKDATVIDCKNKYIYPSFIDIYSDYGIVMAQRTAGGFSFGGPAQLTSNTKGAYGWNQAVHPEIDAVKQFVVDDTKAKGLRDLGFGTVLTHVKDGIARGTGTVVTLANGKENLVILKDKASAHYSLSKGTSSQTYPGSIMGSIALLRQTYIDAQWYKNKPVKEGINLSLQAWNENQNLPQFFEADDKWNDVRADRIGDEFGIQYIIKGGGNEYQRIKEIAATKATYIIGLNFPQAMDVEDPNDARAVSLGDMKHWELAPSNAAALEKGNISFCLTLADLRDQKNFIPNLRKAIDMGLTETKTLEALTKTPATILGIYDKVGSIDAGKQANFIITSGPVFASTTNLLHNWVGGEKYNVKEEAWSDVKGNYTLTINTANSTLKYNLEVKNPSTANVIGKDTLVSKFNHDGKMVKLSFSPVVTKKTQQPISVPTSPTGFAGGRNGYNASGTNNQYRLSGVANGNYWSGTGEDTAGNKLTWTASLDSVYNAVVFDTATRRRNGNQKLLK